MIDVLVASDRWNDAERWQAVVRRAVSRAAASLSTSGMELGIVFTDDSAIRALNRDWRGIDAATNVLSFPTKNAAAKHLGDIVLGYETIAREARSECKPFAHHLAHLAVHGFLHLVGYDHEKSKEALEMERTERDILRTLAIPDPYRPRRPRGGSTTRRPQRKRASKDAAKRAAKS